MHPHLNRDQVVLAAWRSGIDTIRGERIEIRGLGSFKVKSYDGYKGRNPKTGEMIDVARKKLPFFKVGKELIERVDLF